MIRALMKHRPTDVGRCHECGEGWLASGPTCEEGQVAERIRNLRAENELLRGELQAFTEDPYEAGSPSGWADHFQRVLNKLEQPAHSQSDASKRSDWFLRRASQLIDGIKKYHRPSGNRERGQLFGHCVTCMTAWPCPTARLVEPQDEVLLAERKHEEIPASGSSDSDEQS